MPRARATATKSSFAVRPRQRRLADRLSCSLNAHRLCGPSPARTNSGDVETTAEELAADIQRTETAAELEPTVRQRLLELYKQAQGELHGAAEWSRSTAASRPRACRSARSRELPPPPPPPPSRHASWCRTWRSLRHTFFAPYEGLQQLGRVGKPVRHRRHAVEGRP